MREFACWCYAQPTTTRADACGVCGWPKSHHHDNKRSQVTWDFPVPRVAMLGVWLALGGDFEVFEEWIDDPRRSPADAWAQLLAAIEGDADSLAEDTNPPADQLLGLVRPRPSLEWLLAGTEFEDWLDPSDIDPAHLLAEHKAAVLEIKALRLAARRVIDRWLDGTISTPEVSDANAALLALRRALGDPSRMVEAEHGSPRPSGSTGSES